VQINGVGAVMAASSESMTILPARGLRRGPADVTVLQQRSASAARLIFLSLSCRRDTSPWPAGQTTGRFAREGDKGRKVPATWA